MSGIVGQFKAIVLQCHYSLDTGCSECSCYIQIQRQTDQSWISWINDLQNHGCHCWMSLADVRNHLTPFASSGSSVLECQGRGLRVLHGPAHPEWLALTRPRSSETTRNNKQYATLCDDFLRLLPQISSLWSGTVSDISSFRFIPSYTVYRVYPFRRLNVHASQGFIRPFKSVRRNWCATNWLHT